jgi:hypothetical protein
MTDTPGSRRTKLADPTAERTADPVQDDEQLVERENPRRADTPRRYEEETDAPDTVMPSDDSTLKTKI